MIGYSALWVLDPGFETDPHFLQVFFSPIEFVDVPSLPSVEEVLQVRHGMIARETVQVLAVYFVAPDKFAGKRFVCSTRNNTQHGRGFFPLRLPLLFSSNSITNSSSINRYYRGNTGVDTGTLLFFFPSFFDPVSLLFRMTFTFVDFLHKPLGPKLCAVCFEFRYKKFPQFGRYRGITAGQLSEVINRLKLGERADIKVEEDQLHVCSVLFQREPHGAAQIVIWIKVEAWIFSHCEPPFPV